MRWEDTHSTNFHGGAGDETYFSISRSGNKKVEVKSGCRELNQKKPALTCRDQKRLTSGSVVW